MTSYHNRSGSMAVFEFLPGGECEEKTVVLSEAERELKQRLIGCYPTQWNTLRLFPVEIERFRPAPRYEFTQAPHAGPLFYECFPWGMTGERFRSLAREAMETLGITEPL
jgi:N-acetylglucosamine malate deacetylase 2